MLPVFNLWRRLRLHTPGTIGDRQSLVEHGAGFDRWARFRVTTYPRVRLSVYACWVVCCLDLIYLRLWLIGRG